MNILQELKERLDKTVRERNEVESALKTQELYNRYLQLQEEISEVNKAIKALEHSCSYPQQYYLNQGLMGR